MTRSLRSGPRAGTAILAAGILACNSSGQRAGQGGVGSDETGPAANLTLAPPDPSQFANNRATKVGWPAGRTPMAQSGFSVTLFADSLDNPRWTYQLPNGDVLAVESIREVGEQVSSNRITLFRDANNDGLPELRETFLTGLNMPFGVQLLRNWLYVANTNALVRYPYRDGQTRITSTAETILDLPGGGHYTRNVVADSAGRALFVSVGSTGNVDEDGADAKDPRRAAILQVNPDGSGMRVFASGLRNPVGMDWEPVSGALWTVVNERDGLGDRVPPDFLTSVREGAFYGWPYSYYGQNEDPRKKGQRPDLVAKAVKPDFALGAHVAPLGLAFYRGSSFPAHYHGGAFVGLHGSWNRSSFVGFKVAFVPFENGQPAGTIEDFLTGFVASESRSEVYGRPVGVTDLQDGSLLVADDWGGKLWRVSAGTAR